jgi:hypothetical protein
MVEGSGMSTGIKTSEDCIARFTQVKQFGKEDKLRFVIFKIDNQTEIIVESFGAPDKGFDDFKSLIPKNEPRYKNQISKKNPK